MTERVQLPEKMTFKQIRDYMGWAPSTLWNHARKDKHFPQVYSDGHYKFVLAHEFRQYLESMKVA